MNEKRIIEQIQPIRGFAVAAAVNLFFESGLFGTFASGGKFTLPELTERFNFHSERLAALLLFLSVEEFLNSEGDYFFLTEKGHELEAVRGWYRMFIGGYGSTFLKLNEGLPKGAPPVARDGGKVGDGSGLIGHYDATPTIIELLKQGGLESCTLADFGCGNALTLIEICENLPSIRGIGVEPNHGGFQEAQRMVSERKLVGRIALQNRSLESFLDDPESEHPGCIILAFVLHEVLGSGGEHQLSELLSKLRRRFSRSQLLVIEVDRRDADVELLRSHGLARAYYNPYYLLHPFTDQKLMPLPFWRRAFESAGYRIAAERRADHTFDSTDLMCGFLLTSA